MLKTIKDNIIGFIFVSILFTLIVSMLEMCILWNSYSKNNQVNNVVVLLSTSFIFKSLIALVSGVFVDKYTKKAIMLFSVLFLFFLTVINFFFTQHLWSYLIIMLGIEIANELWTKSYISYIAQKLNSKKYIEYDAIENICIKAVSVIGNFLIAYLIAILSRKYILIILIISLVLIFVGTNYIFIFEKNDIHKKNIFHIDFKKIFNKKKFKHTLNNKYIWFMIILFTLNLSYGYIPSVFPYFLTDYLTVHSPLLIGVLKSGINIGEIIASFLVIKFSKKVSLLTNIGLIGSAVIFALFPLLVFSKLFMVILFFIYGFFDFLTQPFFSYFVSTIPNNIRGKVLGIIDSVVFIAAPIGMILGNYFSKFGIFFVCIYLILVFIFSLLLLNINKFFSKITLK
jgi:DHA3 family macrolide efflux protein-like MFS transporter